jgi:type IV secretion system protein VirB9
MKRLVGITALALALIVFDGAASAQTESQTETTCRAAPVSPTVTRPPPPARRGRTVTTTGPAQTLAAANQAARNRPEARGFQAARQIYTYAPGALYELYASPNYISSILLEPGETLNDIAAGDTARWMVTETTAETELDGRTIVLVKPQTNGLRTNIVLVTDRRTYLVEAIAQEGDVYSAQIAWCYPQTGGVMSRSEQIASLNFAYRVRTSRGRAPHWSPTRVFDDGRRTWIEFPQNVAASDMPPLFVVTPEGAEIVNYRVQGQRYMVDRLFDVAELRLGTRAQTIVRIERTGGPAPQPPRRIGRP